MFLGIELRASSGLSLSNVITKLSTINQQAAINSESVQYHCRYNIMNMVRKHRVHFSIQKYHTYFSDGMYTH